ncbi:MAG TPA: hypothetical protein VI755_05380, partial [Anaerolineales bacterium]|nr:hypothetical protein [Anaerolineales bacterium]
MQAHPTGTWLPEVSFNAPQSGKLLPRLPTIARAEQGSVFGAGVDLVRIGQRGFKIPDSLELPGVLR